MKKTSKPKTPVKEPVKVSRLGKAWKDFAKNKNNDEKLVKFYEVFLNTNFWIKLDPSEEKNYARFKKQGIKFGEKFRAAMASDGTIPLFEGYTDLQKIINSDYKKSEKPLYA